MTEIVKSGRGGRRPGAGRKKISPFTQEQQALVWVDEVKRSPAGKQDYCWAKEMAADAA